MHSYLEKLARASLDELEAPARRAVTNAVTRAWKAGLSTVGTRDDGTLVAVHPDGSVTELVRPTDTATAGDGKAGQGEVP